MLIVCCSLEVFGFIVHFMFKNVDGLTNFFSSLTKIYTII